MISVNTVSVYFEILTLFKARCKKDSSCSNTTYSQVVEARGLIKWSKCAIQRTSKIRYAPYKSRLMQKWQTWSEIRRFRWSISRSIVPLQEIHSRTVSGGRWVICKAAERASCQVSVARYSPILRNYHSSPCGILHPARKTRDLLKIVSHGAQWLRNHTETFVQSRLCAFTIRRTLSLNISSTRISLERGGQV